MFKLLFLTFGISSSVILLQLVQTRIFSVLFWNHLVYFIISIALLGFGMSGTWLALGKKTFLSKKLDLEKACAGFVISTIVSSFLAPRLHISLTPIFDKNIELYKLLLVYLIAVFPYFFSGWMLGIIFRDNPKKIHLLYYSDLVGAAMGCIIYLACIQPLGAVNLILLTCILTVVPVMYFLSGEKILTRNMIFYLMFFASLFFFRHELEQNIMPESSKGMMRNYSHLDSDDKKIIEYSQWNTISRIDVVSTLKNPDSKIIYIDGDAWTNIPYPAPEPIDLFDENKDFMLDESTAYLFNKKPEHVLVIGSGGGIDVFNALKAGAKYIDAVEINPTTKRLGLKEYRSFNNDLFYRNGVRAYNEEGRSFVKRSSTPYDVIVLHGIDTFAAQNAGAYVLSENYLYTVEALSDYFRHLKPGGIVCITRWNQDGEIVRLFSTGLETLYALNVKNPNSKIMEIGTNHATLLLRNTEFSDQDVQKLRIAESKFNASLLYPSSNPTNDMQKWLKTYADLRSTNRQNEFFESFRFNVKPTYDDNPFFFHYEKWRDNKNILVLKSSVSLIRGNWPTVTLWTLLLTSFIAVTLFIFTPLLSLREKPRINHFFKWISYFSCLGVSFIFIEITLMQKFALLLGHPARSIALVLGTLLFSAGIGSFYSVKLKKHFPSTILILVLFILFVAFAYPSITDHFLKFSLWVRGFCTVVMVAPLGFLMGIPFPTGINQVSENGENAVPWMWGINGGTSVLGSISAIIIAINFGFKDVILLAACGYFIAFLCFSLITKSTK